MLAVDVPGFSSRGNPVLGCRAFKVSCSHVPHGSKQLPVSRREARGRPLRLSLRPCRRSWRRRGVGRWISRLGGGPFYPDQIGWKLPVRGTIRGDEVSRRDFAEGQRLAVDFVVHPAILDDPPVAGD